jgi:hypothetical protein
VGAAAFADGRTTSTWSEWSAGATLSLLGEGGQPLEGATVAVKVRVRRVTSWGYGYYQTSTTTVTIGADGRAEIGTGPYGRSGNGRVDEVRYLVDDVIVPEPGSWDGSTPSLTLEAP